MGRELCSKMTGQLGSWTVSTNLTQYEKTSVVPGTTTFEPVDGRKSRSSWDDGYADMTQCHAIHLVSYIPDGSLDFFHQRLVMCILPRVKSDRVIVTACGGADTVPTEVGWGCPIVVGGSVIRDDT